MNKILVCSHGKMAEGIVDTMKIIIGNMDNVDTVTFYNDGEDKEDLYRLKKYIDENKGNDVIIFTDIYGGSVNQEVVKLITDYEKIKVITGFNLSCFLELVLKKDEKISKNDILDIIENSRKEMKLVGIDECEKCKDDFDF